ncbi:MAG: single-stranded DNA-binding protein, partial [Limisphaerales bacterium]
ISQYMKKGRPLLMEGRLKLDEWEYKNTHQKVSKLRVVLESFSFLDSNRGDTAVPTDAQRTRTAAAPAAAAPEAAEPQGAPPPEEDDVPF